MSNTLSLNELAHRPDLPSLGNPDHPVVVVIDARTLIGQCTALGLQTADQGISCRSCRTIAEWLESDIGSTSLLLLSAAVPELDRNIALLAACPTAPPFAIISSDADCAEILRYLHKGARGYIPTSQPRAVVVQALRFIAAGGIFVPAHLASALASDPRNGNPGDRPATFRPTLPGARHGSTMRH